MSCKRAANRTSAKRIRPNIYAGWHHDDPRGIACGFAFLSHGLECKRAGLTVRLSFVCRRVRVSGCAFVGVFLLLMGKVVGRLSVCLLLLERQKGGGLGG